MKSEFYFIEIPASVFVLLFPEIPLPFFVLMDKRYLVRFRPSSGELEFGFRGDNWHIS